MRWTRWRPACCRFASRSDEVFQYLLDSDKRYRVIARLGQRTDTSDADGQIVEERPVTFSAEQLAAALDTFRGDIEQILRCIQH